MSLPPMASIHPDPLPSSTSSPTSPHRQKKEHIQNSNSTKGPKNDSYQHQQQPDTSPKNSERTNFLGEKNSHITYTWTGGECTKKPPRTERYESKRVDGMNICICSTVGIYLVYTQNIGVNSLSRHEIIYKTIYNLKKSRQNSTLFIHSPSSYNIYFYILFI